MPINVPSMGIVPNPELVQKMKFATGDIGHTRWSRESDTPIAWMRGFTELPRSCRSGQASSTEGLPALLSRGHPAWVQYALRVTTLLALMVGWCLLAIAVIVTAIARRFACDFVAVGLAVGLAIVAAIMLPP